jgi:hypothetical protein
VARLQQALRAAGIDAGARLRPLAGDWWQLEWSAPVPQAKLRAAGLRLAADPAVSLVSPVWRCIAVHGDLCGEAIDTDELWLGLQAEHLAEAQALVALHWPGAQLLEVEPAGLRHTARLRLPLRHCFDLRLAVETLTCDPRVRWAEADRLASGSSSGGELTSQSLALPSDPLFVEQWAHWSANSGAGVDLGTLAAWQISTGSPAVGVLVIDTGVALDHSDLVVAQGADFTGGEGGGGPLNVCDRHGTAVAGALAALADNGAGVAGIAPGVSLFSARAFSAVTPCDGTWLGYSSATARALEWGLAEGARVSINSNHYDFPSAIVAAAYDEARAAGLVHFASAGNEGLGACTWPASLETVHAIGALAPDGNLASFSNHGPELAFVAPGMGVWTCDLPGAAGYSSTDWALLDGTSFAAPLAAGVAALALSVAPQLTAEQLDGVLRDTALDLGAPGPEAHHGHGLPRADRALLHLLGQLRLLAADPPWIALDVGGVQRFALAAGPTSAGQAYLLLGSAGPVGASTPLLGASLPLAADAYFSASLDSAWSPSQTPSGFLGLLDGQGRAEEALHVTAATHGALAGLTLHHAYLVLDPASGSAVGAPSEAAPLSLYADAGDVPQPKPSVPAQWGAIAAPPPAAWGGSPPPQAEISVYLAAAQGPG